MKKILLLFLTGLVLAAGAGDLVTKSKRTFRNYKIKKVGEQTVSIVYLAADGSPDSAEIDLADLPDEVLRALGGNTTSPPAPAPAPVTPPRPRPRPVGFTAEKEELQDYLADRLAVLDEADKGGRAALLSDVRTEARSLINRYAETADFKYLAHDSNGVLAQVIGTGKGGLLKTGDLVYLRGGLPPAARQFRATAYPCGVKGSYGKYANVLFYGADASYASAVMLDTLARDVGNPALFQPAAANSAEKGTFVDNSVVNNYTNILVKERAPVWWGGFGGWGGYTVVEYGSSSSSARKPELPVPASPAKPGKTGSSSGSGRSVVQKTMPGHSTKIAIPASGKR